jgi:hypothetical protein
MATMSTTLSPLRRAASARGATPHPFTAHGDELPLQSLRQEAAALALADLFPDLQAAADAALADLFPALRLRHRSAGAARLG